MSHYFKLSDFSNQHPEWKCKRNKTGALREYFDAQGVLQAVYSYDTCIMARMPDGRSVYNRTDYSASTARHKRQTGAPSMYCDTRGIAHCEALRVPVGTSALGLVRIVENGILQAGWQRKRANPPAESKIG